MQACSDFVSQSLELHLFFARIMKEHSFFLELGFTPKDTDYMEQADILRQEFDQLLSDVVSLSSGVVSHDVLHSGEVITKYTLEAEKASAYYTGIRIPFELTKREADLTLHHVHQSFPSIDQNVYCINQRAIDLISALIQFKTNLLSNVLACRMFTVNYPLLIDHILREARLYLHMVKRLQKGEKTLTRKEALEQELFWNRIMAEHAKFIRGLLDPTENELFQVADNFGKEFDQLTKEAKAAMDLTIPENKVTAESFKATKEIRDFKAQGTQGILECKIKSIIIPLLGDHTLREANHYLRLLRSFGQWDCN
ncbi:MAG: DUF2935 domain-containing protein [Lachnoclostridium sp.]|jgi:hypothetical protein